MFANVEMHQAFRGDQITEKHLELGRFFHNWLHYTPFWKGHVKARSFQQRDHGSLRSTLGPGEVRIW